MKKTILPALSALGLLAACSGGAEAPKEDAATEAGAPTSEAAPAAIAPAATAPAGKAAADDDNDAAKPAADDHPHGDGEGEHKPH